MAIASALTWKEDCKNLLNILNREEDSEHFREPVDLLRYTKYRKYVNHPMDCWGKIGSHKLRKNFRVRQGRPFHL